jgi:hypothetical protein
MLLDSRLDRLSAQKRDIKLEIKQLEKGIDYLFEKKHAAALRVKHASDEMKRLLSKTLSITMFVGSPRLKNCYRLRKKNWMSWMQKLR